MIIEIAQEAGACFGVERALNLALKVAQTSEQVATLGPLIHNPLVVQELAKNNVASISQVSDMEAGTLILRTHGVVPRVIEEAQGAGLNVLDATCPYVKKVHHAAQKLEQEGYQVLIIGEHKHPEVEGIVGHAPSAMIVSCVGDLDALVLKQKIGVVVQTTQNKSNLKEIVSTLVEQASEVRVINTICEATSKRQSAALDLADRSDCMIVIGGKNSANTTRLYEICCAQCERTYHIEDASEIEPSWFDGVERLGITAGASTPESHIAHVKQVIESL